MNKNTFDITFAHSPPHLHVRSPPSRVGSALLVHSENELTDGPAPNTLNNGRNPNLNFLAVLETN